MGGHNEMGGMGRDSGIRDETRQQDMQWVEDETRLQDSETRQTGGEQDEKHVQSYLVVHVHIPHLELKYMILFISICSLSVKMYCIIACISI